jgi:nickel/cobalt exporter
VALGLMVTVTHTLVIFALAVGVLLLGQAFPLNRIQHTLEIVSSLLVLIIGIWLVYRRYTEYRRAQEHKHHHEHGEEHDHDHAHGHDHGIREGQKLSFKQLLSFGLSGGLVPCPPALAIFVLSVGMGTPLLGMITVVVFSVGLALTLVLFGIGISKGALVLGNKVGKYGIMDKLPLFSSIVVMVMGAVMLVMAILYPENIGKSMPAKMQP